MVAFSLQLVIAQRLMRLVCESCSESYELLPAEWEWIQLAGAASDDAIYVKGKGCSHCNGSGYLGRTGIYEMLEMTGPVVQAANREDPAAFLAAATEAMAGNTLRTHAASLAAAGKTTVDEAMRVTSQLEN
jgi:MSHA biogenesis protein MshE